MHCRYILEGRSGGSSFCFTWRLAQWEGQLAVLRFRFFKA